MAQRGVCLITGTPGWQESGRVDVYWSFKGFQHADEDCGGQVGVTASLTTGAALKAAILDLIIEWYGNHPSGNYDEWDDTPVTGDTFKLIGGDLL